MNKIEEAAEALKETKHKTTSTRNDLQFPRRFFHMSMGIFIGIIYYSFLSHQLAVSILGTAACLVYIFEQVRINYPEHAASFQIVTKYLLRAEEQLKESAGMPFVMGLLLTLLSFPKVVAVSAIFTLAIADPMSAIIGIRFGKNKIVKGKSLEGSAAFFICTFLIIILVFGFMYQNDMSLVVLLAVLVALIMSAFEMIPVRIDDNLTIPIMTGLICWFCAGFLGIQTF
ncbi:hypothetical protein A9Q84_12405 [Halobacteriovorax marinus]|uniref:Phosphatidate cytidylyltransferase n=1 Tax=Halobacteriovorax marinus TaxID=97084 RepID=A0A1Y5F8K7_9BACT|nr:hypothetical protein A9Q84_12405 [Halobacteriovorax marinus]